MDSRQTIRLLAIAIVATSLGLPTTRCWSQEGYFSIGRATASGTYVPPNYLKLVKATLGSDEAYGMYSSIVGDRFPNAVARFGQDEVVAHSLHRVGSRRARAMGLYAEDRFVATNPEWTKVRNPLAPQRDVWRRVNGTIEYGQLKVHGLGRTATNTPELAAVYLASMRKDSGRGQARWFLVPDDHVDSIHQLIDRRYEIAVHRGEQAQATWLAGQKERLQGMGASYDDLILESDLVRRVAHNRIVRRYAGPVITTTFLVTMIGRNANQWSADSHSDMDFVYALGETGSIASVGFATDFLVSRSGRMTASPWRAGGAVTAAVLLTEQVWLVRKYGGLESAISSSAFVVQTGGNVGAAALGLVGFVEGGKLGAIVGGHFGPVGLALGPMAGGMLGGATGGIVGYCGGAWLTDWMLESFAPEFYYSAKLTDVARTESQFQRRIREALGS